MELAKSPSWQCFREAKPLYCPHCHKEVYLRNNSLDMESPQPKKGSRNNRTKAVTDIVTELNPLFTGDGTVF